MLSFQSRKSGFGFGVLMQAAVKVAYEDLFQSRKSGFGFGVDLGPLADAVSGFQSRKSGFGFGV